MTGEETTEKFVVISGCSGGGKSTLLEELRRRGHAVVQEPGRRIVAREIATGGGALPWTDLAAFARQAIGLSLTDREEAANHPGAVFFDRGLLDAAAALDHAGGEFDPTLLDAHRYSQRVFMTPPWPEIYAKDAERRHGWPDAVAEYHRLRTFYPRYGYTLCDVPRLPPAQRAAWVLSVLAEKAPGGSP